MRSRVCVQANFIEWGIFIIWSPTVRNADFKESQGEPPTACYGIELLAQRHSVHPKKHEKFKSVEMWIMHVVYSMRVNVWTLCTWTHTQASCITIQYHFRKKNIRTSWLPLISSITRDCFDTCDTKKKNTDEKDLERIRSIRTGETHMTVDGYITPALFTASSSHFMNSNTASVILLLPATHQINKSGGRPCELIREYSRTQTNPARPNTTDALFHAFELPVARSGRLKRPDSDVVCPSDILYTAFI